MCVSKGGNYQYVQCHVFWYCGIDLLNGDQDHVYVNNTLLDTYAVDLVISRDDDMSRVLVLNATSYEGITPTAFEEVSQCTT